MFVFRFENGYCVSIQVFWADTWYQTPFPNFLCKWPWLVLAYPVGVNLYNTELVGDQFQLRLQSSTLQISVRFARELNFPTRFCALFVSLNFIINVYDKNLFSAPRDTYIIETVSELFTFTIMCDQLVEANRYMQVVYLRSHYKCIWYVPIGTLFQTKILVISPKNNIIQRYLVLW